MMQTRCPACSTVYRITPEQLKARHGQVRCGHCQHIFNALDSLLEAPLPTHPNPPPAPATPEEDWPKTEPMDFSATDEDSVPDTVPEAPQPAAEPTAEAAPEQEETFASLDDTSAAPAASTEPTAATVEEPPAQPPPEAPAAESVVAEAAVAEPVIAEPATPEPATPEPATPEPPAAAEAPTAPAAPVATPAQRSEPLLHEDHVEAPRPRSWPWLLASLLALLVLTLQALVQFRVEAAVLAPDLKPALETLCSMLDCDLPLPRKADQLSIETSDLHPDPRSKGQLILVATLKNRAPFAQTLPHLELTLTDTVDQPLLRKIITPAEYLPQGSDAAAGFAAGGEIAVNLALIPENAAKAGAAGYRLYLFYP